MKRLIRKVIFAFRESLNRCCLNNKLKLRGAKLKIGKSLLTKSKIISKGNNNVVIIGNNCLLTKIKVNILGNNNQIYINSNCTLNQAEFWIEDDNNKIIIGENTKLCGQIHLACIEGTSISVGKDCLFSSNIAIVTGDSHSILDNNGKRINPSASISISDHVWVGQKVIITKGVYIAKDCVIGAGAVVNKSFENTNCILAGVPAKIVKQDINWDERRIAIEENS